MEGWERGHLARIIYRTPWAYAGKMPALPGKTLVIPTCEQLQKILAA
jgi:hypothetical protein